MKKAFHNRADFSKMPSHIMFTARTLNEGRWPLLILLALTVAGMFWCWIAAMVSLVLLAFTVWFFRDPERSAPADAAAILAPGDGKVVEITTVHEPHFLKTDATMVAIFLSVFNVHVQRAPITGKVQCVQYHAGKFLDARHPQATAMNENRVVGLEASDGYRVTMRQIAGLIARRIVGWADTGAQLTKGDRLGMIRFGSRVELFLPAGTELTVAVGQHVKGGETIVARKHPTT